MKKTPELADDQMCFGCGKKNARGLQLDFELDAQQRRLRTPWDIAVSAELTVKLRRPTRVGEPLDNELFYW